MKRSSVLFLAAAILLAVIGPGSFYAYKMFREAGQKYETVRVAESRPEAGKLPHYLAEKMSLYGEQKTKIKRVDCAGDREALAALESGRADVALVESSSLVIKRASELKEGTGPVAFASLDRGTAYHLLAREDKPMADIRSLKGKTVIAGPQDSLETAFLENVIREAGISPYESVTIITNIPEEIRIGAFKAGTSHYLLVGEKDLAPALARGFFQAKTMKTEFPVFVCVSTREIMRDRPEALQRFTNALYMAQIWLKHHTPAETAGALGSIPGTGKDFFPELVARCYALGSIPETPLIREKDMETVIKILDRSREIPMPVSGSDLVTARFAENSVKTVRYIPEDRQKTFLQRLKFWD
ncbi:MAG: ABC transporter substrate-binding protein [Peptococcaceae bacterium]|nr:ABC transporter substrate-binding protein [Peptococcaceae bacterium]